MSATRFTLADRLDYRVAELRAIARDHDITVTSRMTHRELVAALVAAGVDLPPKPPERTGRKS